ncbi:MAG TPA: Fic family protein [Rhizomicrobium sp.]|nr:Fic family protein [Rhizomicrobium sp.]
MSAGDPYVYPGLTVLRNKLGIRSEAELDHIERLLVAQRAAEGIPSGNFDLEHLKAIHHHLFQDVYDWAGEVRTVELNKGNQQFQFRQYIETGMADIHRRLTAAGFLKGLDREAFAREASKILGDVNYVHPFREGNGRVQLYYLGQLAALAGHAIDLTRIDPQRWIAASRASHDGDYASMAAEIGRLFR